MFNGGNEADIEKSLKNIKLPDVNTNVIDRKLQMRNEVEIPPQKELNNWKSLFETLIGARESNKFSKGFENFIGFELYILIISCQEWKKGVLI